MKIEARFVSNQSTKALIVVLFYLYESSNLYHLVSMISQSCTLWSLWNRLSLFRLYVVSWFCKLCTYLPTYLPTYSCCRCLCVEIWSVLAQLHLRCKGPNLWVSAFIYLSFILLAFMGNKCCTAMSKHI